MLVEKKKNEMDILDCLRLSVRNGSPWVMAERQTIKTMRLVEDTRGNLGDLGFGDKVDGTLESEAMFLFFFFKEQKEIVHLGSKNKVTRRNKGSMEETRRPKEGRSNTLGLSR